jgi:competence protein ComEC
VWANSSEPKRAVGRSPCVPIVTAFSAGIAADHTYEFGRVLLFTAAAVLLTVLVVGRQAHRPIRVMALLFLYAVLGAAAHGAAWRDRGVESVVRLIGDRPRLVRVTGRIVSPPVVNRRRDTGRRAAWLLVDRTRAVLEVDRLAEEDAGAFQKVSGRVQLSVAGHLLHVNVGDRVEVFGWLASPGRPTNPGDFDSEHDLRRRGIDGLLYADHPEAVRRLTKGQWGWRRALAQVRERLSVLFATHLSRTNAPVGAAMVLGDRSSMPRDVRDVYIASGAMHVLAISGLHVGILALVLVVMTRLLNLPTTVGAMAVVACVWIYAGLTGLAPPVMRAAAFLTIWALATATLRRPLLLNTVAATALVFLLFDPLLLFDVGARLSFLAILGIRWSMQFSAFSERLFDPVDEPSWKLRLAISVLRLQVMSLGIWLFTAPIVAAEFGVVSPVGFALNVVLIPLVTVVMWLGYAFFGVCLLVPQLAGPFGSLFDFGLSGVNGLVGLAGRWQLGHVFTAAPPVWWIAGYYGLVSLGLICPTWVGRRLRSLSVLLAWLAVGLLTAAVPVERDGSLRLIVLDTGHGGAMLVETPAGRTFLFDCGSMEDNRYIADSVWRVLRDRGHASLDALIISHADLDHCNNVPALLHGGRVGTLIASRTFLDFNQQIVAEACEAARKQNVPIRLVAEGDRLRLDPTVSISVLHPPDRPPANDDNANSIVIEIEYAGRVLLLTGDVEGPGQEELFQRAARGGYDVLVAPHHGGRMANTTRLAEWAQPKTVLVSCGHRVNRAHLEATYVDSRLYLTSRDGAVTVQIKPNGNMAVSCFASNTP